MVFSFFMPPQQPDELGRLGSYRVLGALGAGGMGAVFRAEDPVLRRHIALKVLLPQFANNATAKARFLREARAQAAVEHDHIIAIYQVGESADVPFIAMPLLKGQTLSEALKATPIMSVPEAIRIAREMAAGLDAAHSQNLIHRDIKPANVWLEGPDRRVKILDFGLARGEAEADGLEPVTQEGAIIGTPAYMSPEQAQGKPVDARTDLFSLGVVLYQLLTGRQPFIGSNTPATLLAVVSHVPQGPRELQPQVPAELDAITMRLLAKLPAERPASARRVVEELLALENGTNHTAEVLNLPTTITDPQRNATATHRGSGSGRPSSLESPASTLRSEPPRSSMKRRAVFLMGSLFAVAGVAVVAESQFRKLPVGIENKPVARSPEISPVAAGSDSKGIAKVDPDPKKEPAKPIDDRAAAEWAIKLGGAVRVNDGDADSKDLATLPKEPFRLTGISIVGDPVTSADLAHFKGCKHLKWLVLASTAADDAGIAHFKDCKTLTHLDLSHTKVTDEGLASFRDCKLLTELILDGTKIDGSGLANFAGCRNLQVLSLGSCNRVTDAGLMHARELKNLTELDLGSTMVTDLGLSYFKGCPDLSVLNLGHTRATPVGVAVFKDCKKLSILRLDSTQMTDTMLTDFKDAEGLSSLFLKKTGVTKAGVTAFARSQPQCRIEWDGGVIEPK
jgi:serine/threonine protein kinase